jgi:hypothetical protein
MLSISLSQMHTGNISLHPLLTSSALNGGRYTVSHPCHYSPGKEPKVPIKYEVGWEAESVWTCWRREKSLVPGRNLTPDRPACTPVTILTTLLQLPLPNRVYSQPMSLCNTCTNPHIFTVNTNTQYP